MKNLIFFDSDVRRSLLPLTYTRPVSEIRIGILTLREKWEYWLGGKGSFITQDYLSDKYPLSISERNYILNGSVLPNAYLLDFIQRLDDNEAMLSNGELIAARIDRIQLDFLIDGEDIDDLQGYEVDASNFKRIESLADIVRYNAQEIALDFALITRKRSSQPLSPSNRTFGKGQIFIEEGARIEGATLNTSDGPIYIGAHAEVMEGALIRGSFALGAGSVVRMGTRIYSGTSIGPHCKVAGELSNSVLFGYSNKAHDGFLGDSVIGEWCNLGADTNVSNLKNNYESVKLWNYATERFEPTDMQFCGLIMGDHAKCGINTMFNTGTVVGVGANVFGAGYPRNFIPSFAWGGSGGFTTFRTDKAFETAEKVMNRRKKTFNVEDRLIFLRVFEDSAVFRRWEKPTNPKA